MRPPLAPDTTAFGQAILGVDRVEVLAGHEIDAHPRGPFLPGFRQEDDVAIERHVQSLEHEQRHQASDDVRFVVERPTSVDVAAVSCRAERRKRPLRRLDGDHVCVSHDQQRPPAPVALDTRHEVRASGFQRKDLERNSLARQHARQVVHDAGFVARWVAGVETHDRLEMIKRLLLKSRPVGLRYRPGLRDKAGGGEDERSDGGRRTYRSLSCHVYSRFTLLSYASITGASAGHSPLFDRSLLGLGSGARHCWCDRD